MNYTQQKIRLRAIIGCVLLCVTLGITALIPASAENGTVIRVTADRDTVCVGDEVTLTVTLGPVREMGTIAFAIVLPDGLAYVAGSGQLSPGLAAQMGYDNVTFTEKTLFFNGYASKADYESDEDTVLMTFRCEVTDRFVTSCEVTLSRLEFYSCRTWQNHTADYRVIPAVLSSPQAQTEGSPTEPATEEPQTTEPATEPATEEPQNTEPATEPTTEEPQATEPATEPTAAMTEVTTEVETETETEVRTEVETGAGTETAADTDRPAEKAGCTSSAGVFPAAAVLILTAAALLSDKSKPRP